MAKKKAASKGKSLVIVESPAKARTIGKYLGRKYKVEASIGHVRDLPQGAKEVPAKYKEEEWARLGVNVNDEFTPLYVVPDGKKFEDVGDPVGSGIAIANGVAYFTTMVSNKLVALDISDGSVLKEIDLGPVFAGPSVSRGQVYIGTGNTLFSPDPSEGYFRKQSTGTLFVFGLP